MGTDLVKASSGDLVATGGKASLPELVERAVGAARFAWEEFKQQLLDTGLMTSLPIPLDAATRRDFQPVKLEWEPLSLTIIRERR
jgi:hypothetical protein